MREATSGGLPLHRGNARGLALSGWKISRAMERLPAALPPGAGQPRAIWHSKRMRSVDGAGPSLAYKWHWVVVTADALRLYGPDLHKGNGTSRPFATLSLAGVREVRLDKVNRELVLSLRDSGKTTLSQVFPLAGMTLKEFAAAWGPSAAEVPDEDAQHASRPEAQQASAVLSPDGKYLWTGSEWIPAPPTAQDPQDSSAQARSGNAAATTTPRASAVSTGAPLPSAVDHDVPATPEQAGPLWQADASAAYTAGHRRRDRFASGYYVIAGVTSAAFVLFWLLGQAGAFDSSSRLRTWVTSTVSGETPRTHAISACRSAFAAYDSVATADVERHFDKADREASAGRELQLEQALQAGRRGEGKEFRGEAKEVDEVFLHVQALVAVGPALVTLGDPPAELTTACARLGVRP